MSAKTKVPPYYVAVGRSVGGSVPAPSSLGYSLDGVTWAPSTLPAGISELGNVVFGEDKFVAITANNTNQAAYSTDGINWTATTLPSSQGWRGLAYGGGKFVVLNSNASNVAAYSTDGINWTATTLPSSASWLSVTYGDGKFVAIARYSSTNAYSTDGITWSAGTMPYGASWQDVAYGGGKFVAIINDSTSFAYSTNGSTWTLGSMPYSYENWTTIGYGDGKFVALVNNSSKSAYSLDGVSWTASSMPSSNYWSAITYGEGKFVALVYASTTTAYSTNGITWATANITAGAGWDGIAYGNMGWKNVVAPYIKAFGTWKRAKSALIKVGGSWKTWFLQGGAVDYQFLSSIDPGIIGNFSVQSIAEQPDGKIILGGSFGSATNFKGYPMYRIVRINTDGTLDTVFYSNIGNGVASSGGGIGGNGDVESLKVLPSGKILVLGRFEFFNPTISGNVVFGGTTVNGIVLLNSNGTLDTAFRSNTGSGFTNNSTANASVVQTDGKIVIVGGFTSLNGASAPRLVRLNSDGTLDTAFMANVGGGFNNTGYSIAVQSDGKLIIVGLFTQFNGITVNGIVRLNSDGTLDTAFQANTGTGLTFPGQPFSGGFTIAVQSDEKIVVGGFFSRFNGATVNRLVRLNSNGTLDTAFSSAQGTGFNDWPLELAVQSNGQIILTGLFTSFNGASVPTFVRLNADGTRDAAFTTNNNGGPNGQGTTVYIRADENVLLGGSFSAFGGASAGKIVQIGGGIAY